jgi:hypothetical protein
MDGTNIKANASKHHVLNWKYGCKLEKQLKGEIEELLRKAHRADKEDLPEGMNIPEEVARRESPLEAIAAAKAGIERRAAQRFAKEQEEHQAKAAAREDKEAALEDRFSEPDPLPALADPVTQMKHRLKTMVGKGDLCQEESTFEPVFGIIKAVMGFRQFLLRGLKKVAGEWDLVCIAYNLKRMYALS